MSAYRSLPTADELSKAAETSIRDRTGALIKFGSLFETEKIVAVFVRHFFCSACQAYVEDLAAISDEKLQAASTRIVVIGCGDYSFSDKYAEDITGFKGPIYADSTRELCRALGMATESWRRTPAGEEPPKYISSRPNIVTRTLQGIAIALGVPHLVGKQGNTGQLGGEFVLGPGLKCSFSSRMRHTEDHVSIEELMKEAGVEV